MRIGGPVSPHHFRTRCTTSCSVEYLRIQIHAYYVVGQRVETVPETRSDETRFPSALCSIENKHVCVYRSLIASITRVRHGYPSTTSQRQAEHTTRTRNKQDRRLFWRRFPQTQTTMNKTVLCEFCHFFVQI